MAGNVVGLNQVGKITVAVVTLTADIEQNHFTDFAVNVPDDMIVIGGGAEGVEQPQGAMLTASFPNEELSEWRGGSKDHNVANPHRIKVYAIGLRIDGMSRADLLAHTRVFRSDSGLGNHPEASATVPSSEFLLVGGGFRVEWEKFNPAGGNMATASFPETSTSWKARSKDHVTPSNAVITSFAIGIKKQLPVGTLEVTHQETTSGSSEHPSATCSLPDGFALTGVGAEAHFPFNGGLLWRLAPATEQGFRDAQAGAKDHDNKVEASTLTVYALGIRLI